MPLTALITALACVQDPPQAKSLYRDERLGLQFEYPKSWKLQRLKTGDVFEIPLEGAKTATVYLYRARYKGTAEDWQLIQQDLARSMRKTLDRQWSEDYLSVPMLFTRTRYEVGGKAQSALVGLLYTAFENKMHFRLEAPAEVSDSAEGLWKSALLTLRTTTGDLPKTEDPDRPSVKPEPPKPTTVWKPNQGPPKVERGKVAALLSVGEAKFRLYLPDGWSLADGKLTRKGLVGRMEVTASVGLPEQGGQELLNRSRDALADFTQVSLREDPKPVSEPSGAVVGQVFRIGKSAAGPLVQGTCVGYCEGVYWVATYRATDVEGYKRDKEQLAELFRLLYAEKA